MRNPVTKKNLGLVVEGKAGWRFGVVVTKWENRTIFFCSDRKRRLNTF